MPEIFFRYRFVSFLYFMPAVAGAENLTQVYEIARSYDSQFQSAQATYDATSRRAEQSKAGLRPTVNLAAALTRAQTGYSQGMERNDSARTIGINASQPLYRPVNRLTVEQGQEQVEAASAALEAARQDLALRVAQAYFDVLATIDALSLVQAQGRAAGEQLAAAKEGFAVGNATITDTLEAQARVDLALAQEVTAANDLQSRRLTLDRLTGRTDVRPAPLIEPASLPELAVASFPDWKARAAENQPAVLQARRALNVATLEVQKAEAAHRPTVDLTVGYSRQQYPNGSVTFPNGYTTSGPSIGVQLAMPLFAGYALQNRVAEALALEDKAQADLDTAVRASAQATQLAFFDVISGKSRVRALQAAETSSQRALEANQISYRIGVRINIDVLNAQSQLFQTRRDLAQARYGVLIAHLKLRQAAGILEIQDLQNIDALLSP